MTRRKRTAKSSPLASTSAPRFGSAAKSKKKVHDRKSKNMQQNEKNDNITTLEKTFTEKEDEQVREDTLISSPLHADFEAALKQLTTKYASHPELFFTTSEDCSRQLLSITKTLYRFVKTQENAARNEFSALPELYTDGLDLEQVWEELQLQNRPTVDYLKSGMSMLSKMNFEDEQPRADEVEKDDSEGESDSSFNSDDDIQFTKRSHGELARESDLNDSTVTEKMHFDSQDEHSEGDNDEGDLEEHDDKDFTDLTSKRPGANDPDPDTFFNLEDFEAFADGKEGIDHLMNVVVDEYDQLQEVYGDDDDSESNSKRNSDQDEQIVEFGIDEDEEDPSMDYSKLSYKDFFDPVAILEKKRQQSGRSNVGASGASVDSKRNQNITGKRDAKDSNNDNEDDEINEILDDYNAKTQKDGVTSSDSSSESESGSNESDVDSDGQHLSKHEQFQRAMKAKIRELEAENMKSRGWALNGEVRAQMRPKDSLMDAELEYQRSTKTAPVITPEVTASLEDLIKQRIKDELWDDVERKLPNAHLSGKKKELADVSTEKSKVGLGQIYAQEFEQRFLGAAAPGEEAARKQEEEIVVLWKKLNYKLDALSNFHYTPKPKVKEMEIRSNVSAIQMEEVIPMGVSNAAAVAPEEVQMKQKGRKGVLVGTEERSAEERQRVRRASKAARRKRRRAKLVDERAVARANPGMGNKYERKKAMEELSRARNVTKASNVDEDVKWTKSADVFRKLQSEVRSGIDTIAESGRSNKRRKNNGEGSVALKL